MRTSSVRTNRSATIAPEREERAGVGRSRTPDLERVRVGALIIGRIAIGSLGIVETVHAFGAETPTRSRRVPSTCFVADESQSRACVSGSSSDTTRHSV